MSQYTFGPSKKPVVMTGATSSAAGAAGYAPAFAVSFRADLLQHGSQTASASGLSF